MQRWKKEQNLALIFLDLCLSDFWILFDHQKWFLAIRLLKVIFNTKASNFMKVFTNFSYFLMSVKHLELSICKET